MYKKQKFYQFSLDDFNMPQNFSIDANNRWVQKAATIPWETLEQDYQQLFSSHRGKIAKPFRLLYGALIIKHTYNFSDKELIEQIKENPYFQYFIGLHSYQYQAPFLTSTLSHFRHRISPELREMISTYIK